MSGRKHSCGPSYDEHYRSPLELEIAEAIAALLKKMVPPGARAVVGVDASTYRSPNYALRLVCDGSDALMAYSCCMKPGHEGRCYSATKSVSFTPRSASEESES